jgi:hypothetical protein
VTDEAKTLPEQVVERIRDVYATTTFRQAMTLGTISVDPSDSEQMGEVLQFVLDYIEALEDIVGKMALEIQHLKEGPLDR